MIAIKTNNLCKVYKDIIAVDNLNIEINEGVFNNINDIFKDFIFLFIIVLVYTIVSFIIA